MEWLKLVGALIVIIGFIRKWDTFCTVIVAGIATGLVAMLNGEMTFLDIFRALGDAFVDQRMVTIFVLTVGAIGVCEHYGLKEKAKDLILKLKVLTCGRLLSIWLVIRELSAVFALGLGGHIQFVRPLVLPMVEGAVSNHHSGISEEDMDKVKGLAAASENFGSFFGQLCFAGSSGALLVASTLTEQGHEVLPTQVAGISLIAGIAALILGVALFLLFDSKLKKKYGIKNETKKNKIS